MKPLSDTVITDSEDLIEVFEHADAEERVSMVQDRVKELKLLVSLLTDETDVSPMGTDIVDAAKQSLAEAEDQLNRLYDMYLGVGAKNYSDLGVGEPVTGDYIGWGASRGEDAERTGHAGVDAPAILETPEASMLLEELVKIANDLDKQGLRKEADYLDKIASNMVDLNEGSLSSGEEGPGTGGSTVYAVWFRASFVDSQPGDIRAVYSTREKAQKAIDEATGGVDDDIMGNLEIEEIPFDPTEQLEGY